MRMQIVICVVSGLATFVCGSAMLLIVGDLLISGRTI